MDFCLNAASCICAFISTWVPSSTWLTEGGRERRVRASKEGRGSLRGEGGHRSRLSQINRPQG
jgi:hypothetical protein